MKEASTHNHKNMIISNTPLWAGVSQVALVKSSGAFFSSYRLNFCI